MSLFTSGQLCEFLSLISFELLVYRTVILGPFHDFE